jgi:hypothetical protein
MSKNQPYRISITLKGRRLHDVVCPPGTSEQGAHAIAKDFARRFPPTQGFVIEPKPHHEEPPHD